MDRKFTSEDIFSYEKVNDNLFIVKESYSWLHRFPIGVVIGENKAYVIDSGLGCGGSLKEYVENNITKKPLVCIVTHGHPDHAAGALDFEERYLNEADWPLLKEMLDPQRRVDDLEAFSLKDPEIMAYGKEHVNNCEGMTFKNINDGDVIEDGVRMEIIGMPGHSKGQIAVYLPEFKIAFVSDSVLKRTHFNKADMKGLEEYEAVLKRFIDHVDPDTSLIIGHEQSYVGNFKGWPTLQLAKDLKTAIAEVRAHDTQNDEIREAFFKHQKAAEYRSFVHIHGCASIIYSEKIYFE